MSRKIETPDQLKVGDGVTVCLWTDCYACTVIARTALTITVRRDKATLSPDFHPNFIPGGFVGTVINQHEQSYTYEPNENGTVYRFHWSKKNQRYGHRGGPSLILGRHEFYDYNF